MFVCLLGEKWPALASLSRKNKHAGLRNSPVQGAYSTCPPPPPPPKNNPIKEFALSLGPRLSLFSGTCQSITKVGSRRFVEGLPSGSLFVSPCLPECYLQIETKTEPDLRSLSVKNVSQCIYPGAYGLLIYPILSISHQQLSPLLLYMGLFTAPTWKKDLLLFSFGSSSGVTFWHDKKQSQGRYTTLLCW